MSPVCSSVAHSGTFSHSLITIPSCVIDYYCCCRYCFHLLYCITCRRTLICPPPSTFTSIMYIHNKPCSFLALCNCQFLCTLSPCFQCTSAPVYSVVSKVILTSSSGVRDWPPTGTYRTAAQKRNALRLARAHPTAESKKDSNKDTLQHNAFLCTIHSVHKKFFVKRRNHINAQQ